MRAAPQPEDERPVYPGMTGGKFKPLDESQMQQVYDTSLELLESVGMGQAPPEFIQVVTDAGGALTENGRLLFPRAVVEGAMAVAAKEWVLHGQDEAKSLELGGERVYFGTAGAAVLILDHETQRFRESTLPDLYDLGRLFDTLDNIHFFVRPVVTRDLLNVRELDINTAFAVMMATAKPVGTSFFFPQHVGEVVSMYDMALGGDGEFEKRPFVIANNTFVVPPLRFAEESAACMVEQVRYGMPVNLLSAGQAGATSPAALAGSLAQALAECLSALTCVNLMRPGHPCVMGLWPFVSDLRTGAMTGGSGEEAVLNAAAAQVTNWLGLPSGVAAGMADSKIPDAQAGYEKGVTLTLAGQAGANMVFESAGMLGSLLACSPEMMVIDNDLLGSVNRTIRGIEVNEQTLSSQVIKEVVNGPQHFLGEQQTLEIMQTEYTYPLVGDRLSPDDWIDAGAKDVKQRAHEYVTETLATHYPAHIDVEVESRIRDTYPIRLEEIPR